MASGALVRRIGAEGFNQTFNAESMPLFAYYLRAVGPMLTTSTAKADVSRLLNSCFSVTLTSARTYLPSDAHRGYRTSAMLSILSPAWMASRTSAPAMTSPKAV